MQYDRDHKLDYQSAAAAIIKTKSDPRHDKLQVENRRGSQPRAGVASRSPQRDKKAYASNPFAAKVAGAGGEHSGLYDDLKG